MGHIAFIQDVGYLLQVSGFSLRNERNQETSLNLSSTKNGIPGYGKRLLITKFPYY